MAGRPQFLAALLAAAALATPQTVRSEPPPLVREMLENLSSVNEIGEAVALDDFERVKRAAADLEARAGAMMNFDVSRIGIAPDRDGTFDSFLQAQQQAAQAIAKAAKSEDGALLFRGMERLLKDACIACHTDFRSQERRIRPSVLFMTSYLDAWQGINRGVMTDDFELVARQAHEIQTVGRVFTWDQVIEATFGLADPEDQSEFREFLRRVTTQARRIERAADEEKVDEVLEATRRMWTDGCLACHEQFRGGG